MSLIFIAVLTKGWKISCDTPGYYESVNTYWTFERNGR